MRKWKSLWLAALLALTVGTIWPAGAAGAYGAGAAGAVSAVEPLQASSLVEAEPASESKIDLAPNARSAVLMDADTGTILFEKNAHEKLPPASITKIMTMLLVVEAIEDGKLAWGEKVRASEHAASMGGSQIYLEPGEEMTVSDLMKGVALASGNDASVALAEKVAGSEELFVEMMNERARQLGMKNTRFANSSGLPAKDHVSTAYDIALMSRELLKHEEITKYTGLYQDYLRKDSDNPFWLVNTNKLVRFYTGADGLKTGYTSEAKFCLAATAKRGDMRVIAVVLGEPNSKTRNEEVAKLLDYAFSQYNTVPIVKKGETLGELRIAKGEVNRLPINADRNYSVLVRKGAQSGNIRHEVMLEELKAPLTKGQPVGKIVVYGDDRPIKEFVLTAPRDVRKAGLWTMMKRTWGKVFLLE